MTDESIVSVGSATIRPDLPVWDDAAFKQRVRAAAEKAGMRPREALREAGVSQGYLDKSGQGRASDVIEKLATILNVSPAYLAGWSEEAEKPVQDVFLPTHITCANGFAAYQLTLEMAASLRIMGANLAHMAEAMIGLADQVNQTMAANKRRDGGGG